MHTLPSFFCATTMLDTHVVGSVSGAMICLSAIASNSALTTLHKATGNLRGGLITGTTTSGFI